MSTTPADWHPLPERSRALFLFGNAVPYGLAGLALGTVAGLIVGAELDGEGFAAPIAMLALPLGLAGALFGAWLGHKQYRYTSWRLDREGLAVRRGRLWQRETRVPATRVQHLDLKRGPLQRGRGLSTLVVHTAGSAHSSVAVPNLDEGDAEWLREQLGRQIDHDDD